MRYSDSIYSPSLRSSGRLWPQRSISNYRIVSRIRPAIRMASTAIRTTISLTKFCSVNCLDDLAYCRSSTFAGCSTRSIWSPRYLLFSWQTYRITCWTTISKVGALFHNETNIETNQHFLIQFLKVGPQSLEMVFALTSIIFLGMCVICSLKISNKQKKLE